MPREQFHLGLQQVQQHLLDLGLMVDRQIDRAMQSLADRDVPLADAVIRDDGEVNRARFHLDNICVSLLAQQAPMASDLRLIVAVLAMASDLERMGDHAEGIARIVLMMADTPLVMPVADIAEMATHARRMLADALDALVQRDVEAAYAVGTADDAVDALYHHVYMDLIGIMTRDQSTIEGCTHLLWIAHNLERIADRTTNIAERVVYTVTGMLPQMDVSRY